MVRHQPVIHDLPDARRAAKTWLPADDRDVTSGLVTPGWRGRPECRLHGAMHRIDPVEYIYRCGEFRCGVGARYTPDRPQNTTDDAPTLHDSDNTPATPTPTPDRTTTETP